jgi:hypothetical protein
MMLFKQRWWSRFAFAASVGMAALVACSSDHSRGEAEVQRTGTLGLALEATAASGTVYRLRNAVFAITDVHTGNLVEFLFSEDAPASARELTTKLPTGNYSITLEDGWFVERVSSGGGSGGVNGVGGTFTTGGSAGRAGGGKGGTGTGAVAGTFAEGGAFEEPIGTGAIGFGGQTADFGGFGGSVGTGGTEVDAFLLSDAVQFFSIVGGDDEFVSFLFQIGGQVVDFNHGTLHVGIDVIEDPSVCQTPSAVTDPLRVLLESNTLAVQNITLSDVFGALATNGGMSADPNLIYQQIYDSYASAGNGVLKDAVHCGDEMTNGVPTLNGYPIDCDRIERNHVADEQNFFPTAFANRMDLAPENGAHCGQQRVLFANRSLGQRRAFMIVEAQIPNPHPELGIEGCAPLAQFWLDQNDIADPAARGARLAQAFLSGDPGLAAAGFGPFLTATNLTVGSGQIRTNQFDQAPWTLRQFKLALDGQNIKAVPFPVDEAPNGQLWNDAVSLPQGPACRQSFLDAVDQVLTDDPSAMSFVVDSACKDAESRNDFSQRYDSQLGDGFRAQLEQRLAGTGLSADDMANRAEFAGSCIGCHNEANGQALGNGVVAPFSNDFVHVLEFPTQCGNSDPGQCFQPSPALTDVFLPSRLQVMSKILGVAVVTDPCNGGSGGVGGSGGTSGRSGVGGSTVFGGAGTIAVGGRGSFAGRSGIGGRSGVAGRGMGAAPATGGTDIGSAGAAFDEIQPPTPAPKIDITLPSADEPVAKMQSEDQQIRNQYGDKTLSGRSAQVTH